MMTSSGVLYVVIKKNGTTIFGEYIKMEEKEGGETVKEAKE